jgi:hypothetical protein
MPRTVEEILQHADQLACTVRAPRAEQRQHQGRGTAADDPPGVPPTSARRAGLIEAISVARGEGHSWAAIGAMVGTSGEAARQRYGKLAKGERREPSR